MNDVGSREFDLESALIRLLVALEENVPENVGSAEFYEGLYGDAVAEAQAALNRQS